MGVSFVPVWFGFASKPFLIPVRSKVSFCSYNWSFSQFSMLELPALGADEAVWGSWSVTSLEPCRNAGRPLSPFKDQVEAPCHGLWGTQGPAGWKGRHYPKPYRCDCGPGCSSAVQTSSAWALLEPTCHLGWSPQPQLFCSQPENFISWDRDRGECLVWHIVDLFSKTWVKGKLVCLARKPVRLD